MAKVVAKEMGDEVGMPPGKDAEARRFYGQLLGMRETIKPPGEKGVWFQVEGGTFKVRPDPGHAPEAGTLRARFRVDRAEPLRQAVGRARLRHYDAPAEAGTRGFHAIDPFGNRVELRERAT